MVEMEIVRHKYDARKKVLDAQGVDEFNIKKDLLLADLSGGIKTIATIMAGINAYVQTELAVSSHVAAWAYESTRE